MFGKSKSMKKNKENAPLEQEQKTNRSQEKKKPFSKNKASKKTKNSKIKNRTVLSLDFGSHEIKGVYGKVENNKVLVNSIFNGSVENSWYRDGRVENMDAAKNNMINILKKNKIIEYIEEKSHYFKRDIIQQSGLYFKLKTSNSLTEFFNSVKWEIANHQFKFFAKTDYKSCFDSIYTHAYKWLVEPNTIDSKNADNTNLHITIDQILQHINGKSSNGIVIGPEFSRLISELLLQKIDISVYNDLSIFGLKKGIDYEIYRFVDDIFIFTNSENTISRIIN